MEVFSPFRRVNLLQLIGGGYYWTRQKYTHKNKRHLLCAIIAYKYFLYKRYLAYEEHSLKRGIWSGLNAFVSRLPISTLNDRIENFEEDILGGVLYANLNEAKDRRRIWSTVFDEVITCDECRVISNIRGMSNPSKIVLMFEHKELRNKFVSYLDDNEIAFYGGYSIPDQAKVLKNVCHIDGKIVELPIDEHDEKMQYMLNCIKLFDFKGHNETEDS